MKFPENNLKTPMSDETKSPEKSTETIEVMKPALKTEDVVMETHQDLVCHTKWKCTP